MFSRGLIEPHTDSDLDAMNQRYAGLWHTSRDGLPASLLNEVPHAGLIYVLTAVLCAAGSTLCSLFDLWPGV